MLQAVLDAIGFGLCHQLPERSLFGGGVRVPVCARDAGIYLGFAIALLVLAALHRDRPSRVPPAPVNVLLALGVVAMAVDGLTSYTGLRTTTNEIRLLTGLMTGFALAAWIVPMLSAELWRRPGQGRVLDDWKRVALYLGALVGAYLLIWYVLPYLGVVYALLATIAIVVTFVTVNLVIVTLLPRFERRASRLSDAWLPIMIATALTAAQLAGSAWLKSWLLGPIA